MTFTALASILFPQFALLHVNRIARQGRGLRIYAHGRERSAVCPGCGTTSARVHSGYERRILDQTVSGQQAVLFLTVRRFFCDLAACAKKTFAEQIPGLTFRYGRCTVALRRVWEVIALALGGRAGARLAASQSIGIGRDALIRLIRALPDPQVALVRVLGVDDFALRRGHVYGTVVIDMATRRPVEVLPDREAETLAAWLRAHPGVQAVCRDRAGAYAEGVRAGAPAAIQIADRWHMWHNLAGYVEKSAARHLGCLREVPADTAGQAPAVRPEAVAETAAAHAAQVARVEASTLVARTRQRYEAVQQLKARGLGIKPIMRELGLAKGTVRRFYRAESVEGLLAIPRAGRPSILDEHKPHLHERFNAGHTNASELYREITAAGYRGSLVTVIDYLRPFRPLGVTPPATATPPKARTIAAAILTHPDRRDADQNSTLATVRDRCPHLDALSGHVSAFAQMMTGLDGENLEHWLTAVEADDQPELRSFATGIRHDYDAVRNGLTLPHSSGAVEGNVNRIKMLKRTMYGRAKFDLLRKRILLS